MQKKIREFAVCLDRREPKKGCKPQIFLGHELHELHECKKIREFAVGYCRATSEYRCKPHIFLGHELHGLDECKKEFVNSRCGLNGQQPKKGIQTPNLFRPRITRIRRMQKKFENSRLVIVGQHPNIGANRISS